jgi:SAM-dependent methyltransferase
VRSTAELYDWELRHVHRRDDEDVAFYRALPVSGPVLELACGTGRVASRLRCPLVVGLDIDPLMLAVARARGVRSVVCADMRRFSFGPARFGAVIIPYNSIQLLDEEGMVDCLRCARAHAAPGGVVALEITDFGTPSSVAPEVLASADGVTLVGSLEVNGDGALHYHRRFTEGREAVQDTLSIRPLDLVGLCRLLDAAGLQLHTARQDGARVLATTISA